MNDTQVLTDMYAFALCEPYDIFVKTIEFKCNYLKQGMSYNNLQ